MSISDSNRQQLAASFLTGGEAYDRYRPGFPAEAADAAVDGREDAVVLDVGAGTGKFTELLASRAAQVIAVDPSEDMLAQLRRKLPTVAVRVGPAEDLPVEDAAVDAVTVAQAFHWFDRDRAAAEFARVLRPGGLLTLLWNVPDPDSSWDRACYRIAHHVASPRDDARPDAFPSPALPGFDALPGQSFRWVEDITRADYLARWQTVSGVRAASEEERARRIAEMERVLDRDPATADRDVLPLTHVTALHRYRLAATTP